MSFCSAVFSPCASPQNEARQIGEVHRFLPCRICISPLIPPWGLCKWCSNGGMKPGIHVVMSSHPVCTFSSSRDGSRLRLCVNTLLTSAFSCSYSTSIIITLVLLKQLSKNLAWKCALSIEKLVLAWSSSVFKMPSTFWMVWVCWFCSLVILPAIALTSCITCVRRGCIGCTCAGADCRARTADCSLLLLPLPV